MPTSRRGARFNTLANEMMDAFIGSGEVDAYDAWCEPLPSTIFLSILGLPMTDRDQFIGFKNRILGTARAADLTPEQVIAAPKLPDGWVNMIAPGGAQTPRG